MKDIFAHYGIPDIVTDNSPSSIVLRGEYSNHLPMRLQHFLFGPITLQEIILYKGGVTLEFLINGF